MRVHDQNRHLAFTLIELLVIIAIFCLASFPPVMNRNKQLKLPSAPLPVGVMGISTTINAGQSRTANLPLEWTTW